MIYINSCTKPLISYSVLFTRSNPCRIFTSEYIKPKTFFMKQRILKRSLAWVRVYLVTSVLTILSFSFLTMEWSTIFRAGKGMYEVAKPFAEKWLEQI